MHKRITALILILVTLQLGVTAASAYSSSLQAYYPMNDTSGNVIDYSGNGNDGSISGSITRGVSICNTGAACSTPADGGYINIPDSGSLDISGDITFSFWVDSGLTGEASPYGSAANPADGCYQLHITDSGRPSGNYYIDPDGSGGTSPFEVYCEMSEDGGGWIKLEFAHNDAGFACSNWDKYGDGSVFNSLSLNGCSTGVIDYQNPSTGSNYNQNQLNDMRDELTDLSTNTRLYHITNDDDDSCSSRHRIRLESYTGSVNALKYRYTETSQQGSGYEPGEIWYDDSNYWRSGDFNGPGCDSRLSGNEVPQDFLIPYKFYDYYDGSGGGAAWGYEKSYFLVRDSSESTLNNRMGIRKLDAYNVRVTDDEVSLSLNGAYTSSYTASHSSSELSSGWNHVMISHDDSDNTITYYVNGDQIAQDSFSGSINTNGNNLKIGDYNWKLSDLRIYDTALTPSSFAQEYSNMRTDGDQVNGLRANMINQTGEVVQGADVWLEKAGSDQLVCPNSNYNKTDHNGNVLFPPLDQTKIFDLFFQSSNYQNEFVFRNVRVPDLIEAGYNQNFVPESTMTNSLKFSAGHVLPAQTMITRPFSDFDVVNVSVEKTLDSSYRLVSDVLVRKYNVDFEGSWQDWSNRKTVTVQDIYNRNWDDSGGEMNHAWGIITFNPEGFQKNDCSDVRLTDKNNNVQDFTINTCQDDYVELEFNAPIDALEEKEFYIYYENSGASDAQTAVQRPSETRQYDMETGVTGTADTYFYQDNAGGTKGFNVTIPQNIDFIERSMTVEGDRTKPKTNNLPVSLDTDYEDFTGMEVEPTRRYILQGIDIQMASTTVDSQFVIRNQSSDENIIVKEIPNNGAGEYFFNYTNESVQRAGENLVFSPGDRFLMFVRNGQARRASSTETQRPMFDLTDTTFHRQFFSLNSDGTGGTEGDYPVLVSQIDTIDPEYPTNVTITHDNTGQQVYNGPDQLNNQESIDLSSYLDSVDWREGDPLDDPKLHEFTVTSDTDGNLSMTFDTRVEFEHPVTTVSKTASGCSVNPETQTYFHIDRSDCSYLDRVNVSQGQWFRLDYRFRTPGPNDFDAPGDTNSYNISDTMVRFDILQETEEFTTG